MSSTDSSQGPDLGTPPADRKRAQPSTLKQRSTPWALAYAAVLLTAYIAVIFVHRQPPLLGDLSDWTYQGALLARHFRGLPDPAHLLKHYPVPNSTVTVALALLMLLVPWAIAVKLFVAAQLGLAFLAMRSLREAAQAPALLYTIVPGVVFLGVNFWFGFAAFQLGLTLLLLFTSALLRIQQRLRPVWPISLLLIALFFTHMVPFTYACLLLLLFVLQQRRPLLLLQALPSFSLLAWYVVGRFGSGDPDATAVAPGSLRYASPAFALYKLNSLGKSFGFVNPVDGTQHSLALNFFGTFPFILLFFINMVLTATLLALLFRSCQAGIRLSSVRFIWTAFLLALLAYLLLPQTTLGISDPGSRVLQAGLCVGLFFCNGWTAAWRFATAGSAALAISGLVLFAEFAGSPPQGSSHAHFPAPIELLARAPYAYSYVHYADLAAGRMDDPVFPTALFINRAADVPAPK